MKLEDFEHGYIVEEDGDIIMMFRAVLFWGVALVALALLVVWWIG